MALHPHFNRFALWLLICSALSQLVDAQLFESPAGRPHSEMTGEEVVANLIRRNLERAHALGGYQGTRTYSLEYHGFPGSRSAEMVVDVNYQSPGTKEFNVRSEKGSGLVIDRVFKRLLESEKEALTEENQSQVALNNENYRFKLISYESEPGCSCYILAVDPRTKNKLLYRGRIWVDAKDFAVVRIEGEPAKNPSFWTKETKIVQVYAKVDDFWLPISNRSTSSIRLGGRAYFSIDYKDYHITAVTTARLPASNIAVRR